MSERAVLVVELDLPGDSHDELMEALSDLPRVAHSVAFYAAVRDAADRVLAEFEESEDE